WRILALKTLDGRVRGACARRRALGDRRRLSLLSTRRDRAWWVAPADPWRVRAGRRGVGTEEADAEECDHDAHAHGPQHQPRTLRMSTFLKPPGGAHHPLEAPFVLRLVRQQSLATLRCQRKRVKRLRPIHAFVRCLFRRQEWFGTGRG